MLTVAQVAFCSVGEDVTRFGLHIIKDLEFIELVANSFVIWVYLIVFKEHFIFFLDYSVFVILGIVPFCLLLKVYPTILQYNGPEELEYALFDLAKSRLFIEDKDTRLGQWLL